MNAKYRAMIANEFRNCVEGTISRISHNEQTNRPFHKALLSEEIIFWSAFERSFSTSFGQRVIEELVRLVAFSNGAEQVERQAETIISIDEAHEQAIHNHIQMLRANHRGNIIAWDETIKAIQSVPLSGKSRRVRIISDVWWRKDGVDNYISLKTVKPNIDQTAVAKEDCLHLKIADPNCNVYFGLPYNPFGEKRTDYAFNPPMGIFDFRRDSVVLIGRDLWDTIGGNGCYDELLEIAASVGKETRSAIKRMLK